MSFDWLLAPTLASDVPLDPGIIALLIPITAIIFGSIAVIVKTVVKHRERMAKIGMGIDPDAGPDAQRSSAGQPQTPRYGG